MSRPAGTARRAWLRPTIRLRLTALYGALSFVSGAVLLAITYLLVTTATGTVLVRGNASGQIVMTFSGIAGTVAKTQVSGGPGPVPGLPGPETIQTLALEQHAAEMNQLLLWSVVALAIMAVISIGIGWLVAGRVLAPLRTMTADVRAVSAASLHRRLVLSGPDDELDELGATFNDLMERLERSFDAQRQFVANASHELRTPMARQRTVLQVALADPDADAASLRAAAERALVAGQQQEQLVEALLTLARGEAGVARFEAVDLGGVAARAVESRRPEADSRGLRIQTAFEAATVLGDPRLLDQLVGNLVDNAIRHNLPGGRLEVRTSTADAWAVLSVANDGAPVPQGEVARLFQPFERLGTERTDRGGGWGLGLSIVRAIASAHGAYLSARPQPEGGLEILVRFPPTPPDAAGPA